MKYENIPKRILPRLTRLSHPDEVTVKAKFSAGLALRYLSVGNMYLEYEGLVSSPAPLEVFWQAIIKLLHPIRWRRYFPGKTDRVIEYDLFDKAKWEKLKAQPNLNALIWAFGFPLEGILPRIWIITKDNRLIRFAMWWERSQNEEV